MARHRDPVCGMDVDDGPGTPRSDYQGRTYYFCAEECRRQFEAEPSRYASAFEKAGKLPTPKFGSAGSGGAEFEPGPRGR